jgi:uncharacterized protein
MWARPKDLFDRASEWEDLCKFAAGSGDGLRVAVMHGRRRQGKSYLLRRLAAVTDGFYHQALEEEAGPALGRLGDALGAWLAVPGERLALADWAGAIDVLAGLDRRTGAPVVAILDELPYLLDRVPELSSLVQRAVDSSRDRLPHPVRLVLCGSALSVMSGLLSGQRALRGRVDSVLRVDPFDFRLAAAYWGIAGNWPVAWRLHAIVGGTPGYRDLLALDPPASVADVGRWLAQGICHPSSALFREDDYLLAEERGLNDRALYHSVLSAIAAGNRSETKIGAALGRDRQALAWPLRVLVEGGFVVRDEDALRRRRPSYRIAEPIVRFHHAITRPDLARFEERRAVEAWADAGPRFSTHVLGPHFEDLARMWTARYASPQSTGGRLVRVGATQLSDPVGRSQVELDVVGMLADDPNTVGILGEAKSGGELVDAGVLMRLERSRELLVARGAAAADAKLAVFSAGGFDRTLLAAARSRDDVELVDLDRLYTGE